jgi:hypothetical protein
MVRVGTILLVAAALSGCASNMKLIPATDVGQRVEYNSGSGYVVHTGINVVAIGPAPDFMPAGWVAFEVVVRNKSASPVDISPDAVIARTRDNGETLVAVPISEIESKISSQVSSAKFFAGLSALGGALQTAGAAISADERAANTGYRSAGDQLEINRQQHNAAVANQQAGLAVGAAQIDADGRLGRLMRQQTVFPGDRAGGVVIRKAPTLKNGAQQYIEVVVSVDGEEYRAVMKYGPW